MTYLLWINHLTNESCASKVRKTKNICLEGWRVDLSDRIYTTSKVGSHKIVPLKELRKKSKIAKTIKIYR